jgi:apolipoprotein D and lipocalin family protein
MNQAPTARRVLHRQPLRAPFVLRAPLTLLAPFVLLSPVSLLTGCAAAKPVMPTVDHVDLTRFSGDWFVIAHIPAPLEKDAHNALESYRVAADGTIETTYTFREGGFDGPPRRHTPRGFVRDTTTNATWGMQFLWPFRMEYLVIYLDEASGLTVIGRTDRDYVWIMARQPQIPEETYQRLVAFVGERGYDVTKLRRVPQRWNGPDHAARFGPSPDPLARARAGGSPPCCRS